ncbi:MAG TPA: hypothetical protein VN763_15595 [Saprospiraceae bacterium]|nr:hypothetical protein [Saprospiraceae bacterium]HZV43098.1 hypothetical protein [Saprospiraceae bacterium]
MKNIELYKILICFGLLWLTYSCEKADQTTTSNVALNGQLESREVASCDQCPIGDCCCSVELLNHSLMVTLRFCGTSDGATGCTASGPGACSSISGGGQTLTLDNTHFRRLYCMNPGDAFSITNLGPSPLSIILTCQHDLTNPQKDTVSIAVGTANTLYFDTDTGCAVAQCL